METILRRTAVFCAFCALACASGCVSPLKGGPQGQASLAGVVIDDWSRASALAARRLMAQYGPPDEIRSGSLTWNNRGPWKRMVVRDQSPLYLSGGEVGVVEQTIEYKLPPAKAGDIKAFSPSLSVDPERGELSSRCDREELNYLNLNLADDIAQGRKTVDEAKYSYENILSMEASGKTSPYTAGFLFSFGR